jgi:monoamine oxidase
VLADEVIAFDPPLPLWKREALAAAPLGRANKVALMIEESAMRDVTEQSLTVPISSDRMIDLRLRTYGRNIVDGYIAGPLSIELEAEGEAATIEAAKAALATLLGSDFPRRVTATAATRWASEPYIRGAYSAAIPGLADRRADLGRPLDDRVFFAGEATSPEFFTTCHGAWETGLEAAHAVAVALGRNPRPSK